MTYSAQAPLELSQRVLGAMTPKQAIEALAKARDLNRRALSNYARAMRAESFGKSAREAINRYDRMSTEADRLLDQIRDYMEAQ